jgi:hypothetical protein
MVFDPEKDDRIDPIVTLTSVAVLHADDPPKLQIPTPDNLMQYSVDMRVLQIKRQVWTNHIYKDM